MSYIYNNFNRPSQTASKDPSKLLPMDIENYEPSPDSIVVMPYIPLNEVVSKIEMSDKAKKEYMKELDNRVFIVKKGVNVPEHIETGDVVLIANTDDVMPLRLKDGERDIDTLQIMHYYVSGKFGNILKENPTA